MGNTYRLEDLKDRVIRRSWTLQQECRAQRTLGRIESAIEMCKALDALTEQLITEATDLLYDTAVERYGVGDDGEG